MMSAVSAAVRPAASRRYATRMTTRPDYSIQLADGKHLAARDLIARKLDDYNNANSGQHDNTPLDMIVTDSATGEVLGGLSGRTSLGVFFVDMLYLPESLRRSGVGSELLSKAEAEAKRRGCDNAVVYTISFQAPRFYEKHGFRVFGEVPCQPAGTMRFFMIKTF
jgi:GNAT superfamily N-acetyltransferase